MKKPYSLLPGIAALWVAAVACRPVIAIGWPEFTLLVVLIAILLGPLMFKLYRFIDRIQKASREEKKKQGYSNK